MATTSQDIQYTTLERFPGYRFGDDGTVWSHKQGGEWRKLKPGKKHRLCESGRRILKKLSVVLPGKTMSVHRLILEAFIGPCPDGLECCHKDGNPENNRLDNLRWGTPRSNMQDAIMHGTRSLKLTESQVTKLRKTYASGAVTQTELANMYSVSTSHINDILHGKKRGPVAEFGIR